VFDADAERVFVDRVLCREENSLDDFAQRIACVPRILAIRNAKLGRPLSEDELRDLAQDAFVVVLRRLSEYRPIAPLESWMHGICCLLLKDAVRNKARNRRQADDFDDRTTAEPPPSNRVSDCAEIERLLSGLGTMEAQVLRLKHLEGLTFVEVASRLRISPNTAKTLHYRALTRLRDEARKGIARQEKP
jgi:RNA polymerase sigma-70 factor (ECF subfamily)